MFTLQHNNEKVRSIFDLMHWWWNCFRQADCFVIMQLKTSFPCTMRMVHNVYASFALVLLKWLSETMHFALSVIGQCFPRRHTTIPCPLLIIMIPKLAQTRNGSCKVHVILCIHNTTFPFSLGCCSFRHSVDLWMYEMKAFLWSCV